MTPVTGVLLATGMGLLAPSIEGARAISGGGKDYASSTLTSSFKGAMGRVRELIMIYYN